MAGWARDPGDGPGQRSGAGGHEARFWDAVNDDLDTPTALAVLHELEGDGSLAPAARFAAVQAFDRFLGLDLAAEVGRELPAGAEAVIAERERARAARDFAAADHLRDRLTEMGVEVTDTRSGTSWRLHP
jgi:cysteinyl-tRNA synthetase